MKAVAVLHGSRTVDLIDIEPPPITQPSQALLRVLEVGICGTDREIAAFEYGTPPDGSDYLVLGHEALAEVVETGPEVEFLQPGDLVVPMVRRPCPHNHCAACVASRPDFCLTGDFHERGIKQSHGFMTELIVEDEAYLAPVHRAIADVAVLVEPLTVTAKAGQQLLTISERLPYEPQRLSALVIGAGAVGLLGAMLMQARGMSTHVYSREPPDSDRAALIESFGARYISSQEVPVEDLAEQAGPFGVIYEAAGSASLAFSALHALSPNGMLIITGVPGVGRIEDHDLGRMMRSLVLNNQVLLGTVNAGQNAYEAAAQGIEQFLTLFPESLRQIISSRVPLEAAPELLTQGGGMKSVVSVHELDETGQDAQRTEKARA